MNYLASLIQARKRFLLVGPPGIGKTGRILDAAKMAGFEMETFRASLCDRLDVAGAVIPDFAAGITRVLPLEKLHRIQRATKPTVLFVDDIGQAPLDVQNSLMSLFDAGSLPDCVLIVGATNRPGDKAGVTFSEPLRSRFLLKYAMPTPGSTESPDGAIFLSTWQAECEAWCQHEGDRGAPFELIAWHRNTSGRTLYQWKPCADPAMAMPDYRSWSGVSDLWNAGFKDLNTIGAAIGRPAAAEFLAFARLASQLPAIDQIWIDPTGAPVPQDSSALYLVASMVAQAAVAEHARALVRYMVRLPRVYCALLAREAMRRIGGSLTGCPEWVKWFAANQELFVTNSGE